MIAALNYLHQMTDTIFAAQMQRAAVWIAARQKVFGGQAE